MEPSERPFPDELQPVAAQLRAERAQADPLQLDEIKRRVFARCSTTPRRWAFMRSKLATVATVMALLGGTGGAIAVGSSHHSTRDGYGASAAARQYPCRHGRHRHNGHCVPNKKPPCAKGYVVRHGRCVSRAALRRERHRHHPRPPKHHAGFTG